MVKSKKKSLFDLIELSITITVHMVLCTNLKIINYQCNMLLRNKYLIRWILSIIDQKNQIQNQIVWHYKYRQEKNSKQIAIDDVMKFYNYVGVGFSPKVRTHTVGVNAYFGSKITNLPLPTPKYGQGNTKYNIDYEI